MAESADASETAVWFNTMRAWVIPIHPTSAVVLHSVYRIGYVTVTPEYTGKLLDDVFEGVRASSKSKGAEVYTTARRHIRNVHPGGRAARGHGRRRHGARWYHARGLCYAGREASHHRSRYRDKRGVPR
jgi:hypothetical protein